jgi:hypothetical protein
VRRLTAYVEQNRDLLAKVAQRQEVWHAFRELERKAKDPSRYESNFYEFCESVSIRILL